MCGLGLLTVAATFALLAVGCGGDSDVPTVKTSHAEELSKAEFIREAKSICRATTDKIQKDMNAFLERRARETGEQFGLVGQVEMVPEVVAPALEAELEQLEALDMPPGEAYGVEVMWQTLRTVLHEVEVEGMFAWRSAKLLVPWRNRARPFELDDCILN